MEIIELDDFGAQVNFNTSKLSLVSGANVSKAVLAYAVPQMLLFRIQVVNLQHRWHRCNVVFSRFQNVH